MFENVLLQVFRKCPPFLIISSLFLLSFLVNLRSKFYKTQKFENFCIEENKEKKPLYPKREERLCRQGVKTYPTLYNAAVSTLILSSLSLDMREIHHFFNKEIFREFFFPHYKCYNLHYTITLH